jgi:hypothetical protein
MIKKLFSKIKLTATQILLDISGLAVISLGIGLIFMPAGVIAGGVSLLLLGWRLSDDE